jgi:HEAT repeat protein
VAIKRSAADEIRRLVDDLSTTSRVARDTATARLSVIGERAVPHLLDGLARSRSAAGQASILRILEATRDRRALDPALSLLNQPGTEPAVSLAVISLIGSLLDSGRGQEALDALAKVAVDQTVADRLRVACIDELAEMPERVLHPLLKRLESDSSPAVRTRVAGAAGTAGPSDVLPAVADAPGALDALDAAAGGRAVDPAGLKALLDGVAATAPLPSLHRLVEALRTHEQAARSDLDRSEWLEIRGKVHLALAARGSRVAVYDLRETLETASGRLPDTFLAALAQVGDPSCLEPVAGALARATKLRPADAEWTARLLATARAIIRREKLTRRHLPVRRVVARWPELAPDLFSRPGQ